MPILVLRTWKSCFESTASAGGVYITFYVCAPHLCWHRAFAARLHACLCANGILSIARTAQTCFVEGLRLLPSDAGPALRDRRAVPPSGINLQPASAFWFVCILPCILTDARPFPFLRTPRPGASSVCALSPSRKCIDPRETDAAAATCHQATRSVAERNAGHPRRVGQ